MTDLLYKCKHSILTFNCILLSSNTPWHVHWTPKQTTPAMNRLGACNLILSFLEPWNHDTAGIIVSMKEDTTVIPKWISFYAEGRFTPR